MVALVLTAAFGILGALSIYFARRDEEGRTFFWTMATLCALAFGFSLGSFNQDAQLRNQIAALNAQLEGSSEASEVPAEVLSSPPTPPTEVVEPADAEVAVPDTTASSNPPLEVARREPLDLPEIVSLPNSDAEAAETIPVEAEPAEAEPAGSLLGTEPTASAPLEVANPFPVGTVPAAIPDATSSDADVSTATVSDTTVSAATVSTATVSAATVPDTTISNVTNPDAATVPEVAISSTEEATVATLTTPASADVTAADLSGTWEMTTTIERTAYPAFAGLELTFRLDAEQNADSLAATGNKAAERAPGAARTLAYAPSAANRIVLTGNFTDADTLALSFEEGGVSGGTMTLRVVSAQRLEGVFLSSSADSGGSVVWRKVGGG